MGRISLPNGWGGGGGEGVRNFGWENFLLGGGFHSDFLES